MLAVIIVIGAMLVVAAVLVLRDNEMEEAYDPDQIGWCVELWHIGYGYQVRLCFVETCVLGRVSLYENAVGAIPPMMDGTISREHGMLIEQDGQLLLHNLSAVNPAKINGFRLNGPGCLREGDRIELGESTFLVTKAGPF